MVCERVTSGEAVFDLQRQFAIINYRTAKGSFALMLGAAGRLMSLAGQEHGRAIPIADIHQFFPYLPNR